MQKAERDILLDVSDRPVPRSVEESGRTLSLSMAVGGATPKSGTAESSVRESFGKGEGP